MRKFITLMLPKILTQLLLSLFALLIRQSYSFSFASQKNYCYIDKNEGSFSSSMIVNHKQLLVSVRNKISREGSIYSTFCLGRSYRFRRSTKAIPRRMTLTDPSKSTTVNSEKISSDKTEDALSYLPENLNLWFDTSLPEGRCIGVVKTNEKEIFRRNALTRKSLTEESNHWIYSVFHPSEIDFAMNLKKNTRNSFWLGRLAIRIALDFPNYPILKDRYGRPLLMKNVYGSISHKQERGVALISLPVIDNNDTNVRLAGIGIDLEMTSRPGRSNISKRVLTINERKSLGNIPGVPKDEEVLLRFSLKEAIYKAAHPLLCQYVSFREAEVTPFADGTASCTWLLDTKADKRIAKLTAHWKKVLDGNFFLTSASVYAKSDEGTNLQ